jgi:hypothetical protein
MLMSPLSLLWLFDPSSVENRIWVTGMKLFDVMQRFKALSDAMLEASG